jgi:hypothetical protein
VRLTEGLWWPELLRRAAGVEDLRRRWGGARGAVDAGRFRVLDRPEGSVRVLQRCSRGQLSPVVTGGGELRRSRGSPAWRSRRRSAPSRDKAAARVVRRVGGWREQGVSVGLKGAPVVIPAGIAAGDLGRARGSVAPRRGRAAMRARAVRRCG